MASLSSKITAVVGVLAVTLCLLSTPVVSFAGVLAIPIGLPVALQLRATGMPRTAFLLGVITVAAAAPVALQSWFRGDEFLYVWAGVLLVAAVLLASYVIAQRRAA